MSVSECAAVYGAFGREETMNWEPIPDAFMYYLEHRRPILAAHLKERYGRPRGALATDMCMSVKDSGIARVRVIFQFYPLDLPEGIELDRDVEADTAAIILDGSPAELASGVDARQKEPVSKLIGIDEELSDEVHVDAALVRRRIGWPGPDTPRDCVVKVESSKCYKVALKLPDGRPLFVDIDEMRLMPDTFWVPKPVPIGIER